VARILAHLCCGPCSIVPVLRLKAEGHEVAGFFLNPNIHPLKEYLRRREAVLAAAARLDIPVLFPDPEYDPVSFFHAVHGRESDRCPACYELRLKPAARLARERGFEAFTSSLLYSKYQNHAVIRAAGERAASEAGVEFAYRDFRDGWQEGIDRSKEWALYRQPYCGCLYSEGERYAKELARAVAESK
jgi:predicted adenine nucleotide alpha hydrolase (AANH) superfamily ATPase